jgi:predicted DNA-binding WGR domain protein
MAKPNPAGAVWLRWENSAKGRYYEVRLQVDLLGDWVLTKTWGSQYSGLGRLSHEAWSLIEEALKSLEKVHQQRLKHGYRLVQQQGYDPTQASLF